MSQYWQIIMASIFLYKSRIWKWGGCTHYGHSAHYGLTVVASKPCCGILLVCSLHAFCPDFASSALYLVIVHSKHLKNEDKQKYGIKTNKIEIKLLRINDKTHVKKKSKRYWSGMHSVLTCDCHPSLVVVYVSYIKISLSYKLVELITQ